MLTGAQGQDWLTNPVLRHASVSFLTTRKRFSHLDTSEVQIRYDAFVSFSNEDRPAVIKIVTALNAAGLRIFFHEYVPLGTRWADALNISLESASTLLYCVGKTTTYSQGQMRELDSASSHTDLWVIPVLLPGADSTNLPDFLRHRQWLDLRAGVSEEGINMLVTELRSRTRRA